MKLLITIYSHARLSAGGAVSACDQSEWPKIHIVIPAIRCVHTMQGRWRMSSRFFHCQDIWTADMWVLDVLRHQAGDQNSEYTSGTAVFILHISLLLVPFKRVLSILSQLVVSSKRLHAWPLSLTGCYAVVWMCVAHRSLTPVTSHLTAAKWSSHFTLSSKQWSRPGSALNGPKLESSLHSPLSPSTVFFMSFIMGFKV